MYDQYLTGAGVPPKDIDRCMEWAFGPGWQVKDLGDCQEYWNKKHNLFKITGAMPVGETIFKIGILFMAYEYS